MMRNDEKRAAAAPFPLLSLQTAEKCATCLVCKLSTVKTHCKWATILSWFLVR